MPSRYLNRRRFEVAADGHTGNCNRVAVFNGCNAALGQTGTFGQKQPLKIFLQAAASGWLPSSRFCGPMTAATYSGHWACRIPSDCSAVKSGHSAKLSQGRPSSVAPQRSKATLTGCELAMPTRSGLWAEPRLLSLCEQSRTFTDLSILAPCRHWIVLVVYQISYPRYTLLPAFLSFISGSRKDVPQKV